MDLINQKILPRIYFLQPKSVALESFTLHFPLQHLHNRPHADAFENVAAAWRGRGAARRVTIHLKGASRGPLPPQP